MEPKENTNKPTPPPAIAEDGIIEEPSSLAVTEEDLMEKEADGFEKTAFIGKYLDLLSEVLTDVPRND